MKRVAFIINLVLNTSILLAQKPSIDIDVFEKWPSVGEVRISNNGNYALYTISNEPVHSQTLVIQSLEGNWKKEVPRVGTAYFSDDSRKVIFMQGKDSLCLLAVGSSDAEYITSVSSFQLSNRGKDEWLAYLSNSTEKQLVLRNLKDGKAQRFAAATDFILSKGGNTLVFKKEFGEEPVRTVTLNWVDFYDDRPSEPKVIWQGTGASNFTLDGSGTQLAFVLEEEHNGSARRSIWYYRAGTEGAVQLAGAQPKGIDTGLKIAELSNFSIDGERLFFSLKEKDYPSPNPEGVKVDIWSYTDAKLQSQQLVEDVAGYGDFYIGPRSYVAVINIKGDNITLLQKQDEEMLLISNGKNDDWALITYRRGDKLEESWNKLSQPSYYLVSTKTGERKAVDIPFTGLSPTGKYLIGDDGQGNWFSYELPTGLVRDITKSVPIPKGDAGDDKPFQLHHRGLTFWGHWLADDAGMLIYDRYDIWQVDPQGVKAPINLTNSYGRRNEITLRFIEDGGRIYRQNDRLILDAFNDRNKNNGFYSMVLGKRQDPIELTMGSYVFYADAYFHLEGKRPIKARDVMRYIVRRNSANESPNYFWTDDFKRFTVLSDVYPEKGYNWLRSELIEFTTLDGRKEQGILYKPEDFDPDKKYPIIIHYYDRKSERLNQYFRPYYSDGDINIPYFVSQRYLVFTPDIHYTLGEVGQSAYNSIVGAGEHLSRLPWVDATRIGLSGHSFGGFETNYIITRSNLFAAACADAGAVDFISSWGTYELSTGRPLQALHELESYRMGVAPWQNAELYIKNSPIFQVDKVTTPVLIINNKLDAVVHFAQGVQFFTALRRLGKRAWLLQYDGERHSVFQRKNKMDLTIRIRQFFDHYLKGSPAPKWMIRGIPAKLKGIDNGLEYYNNDITPGIGLLNDTSKAKIGKIRETNSN